MATLNDDALLIITLLKKLSRAPNCWCEHGIGNPMVSSHSATCKKVNTLEEIERVKVNVCL